VDNLSNLFSFALKSIQASEEQFEDLQLVLVKRLVRSFATTMDTMQKTKQDFILKMIKALTGKCPSQKK
jgi:hypothetical protein